MNLHEHQAKDILRQRGARVPMGLVATSVDEAAEAARELALRTGSDRLVVKAQLHAGGRGKAGGIRAVRGESEAVAAARSLLGSRLVTAQTGPRGSMVRRVLLEQAVEVARELYAAILVDRNASRALCMLSGGGGVNVEAEAGTGGRVMLRELIDPVVGLADFQARNLAFGVGLDGKAARATAALLKELARAFVEVDASLLEVNPLAISATGEALVLDCKLVLDDNALFRHPELALLRDASDEDAFELDAEVHGLRLIKLDGDIGCMVNGAGLAMATMDVIQLAGGAPANFLDVGGGASVEQVTAAFRILSADPAVRGIFVNIFGGIMHCDVLARGLVEAVRQVGLRAPLVVRLEGTNVEEGRAVLTDSGLNVIAAADMAEGARLVVELARGG